MDTEEEQLNKKLVPKKDKHDIILVQVYVDDIIFGSTKKSWCDEFEALMKSRFQMSSMGELTFFLGLQVKQKPDVHQLRLEALVCDEEASDVDVISIGSMIGFFNVLDDLDLTLCLQSDALFEIVTMLEQILTGNPQQEVVNFLAGDSFLGNAKKQTIGLLSTTEASILAMQEAYHCGYFYYRSRNPVYHSKTKHIAIRHHFIRDAYEKKLIQVLKIHTDDNVADLLTKAFDVSRFQFLVVTIGMINP
ncbi:putative ribonuclease H-like domain-containing protein [Tanacetum coccineum]|uniref:Ribonuclease H-like domain-containing protein n=1 Tax=Tanacetum coccineum TaxID=301880 RepID=A0ABQ5CC82_9ASTR